MSPYDKNILTAEGREHGRRTNTKIDSNVYMYTHLLFLVCYAVMYRLLNQLIVCYKHSQCDMCEIHSARVNTHFLFLSLQKTIIAY